VDQTLRVKEPPKLTALGYDATGFHSNVIGLPGSNYVIEASLDLADWSPLTTVTNSGRTEPFTDPPQPDLPKRFYRARNP
jgi:hypothetical protein